ncbi:hypothetical protein DHW03_15065 [Pedobacter yonginense]|uniref:Beta-lactamase-related domain-containing protein n=1 Tax=Pedobacter yonginense TaxID=651869 RepID=A0A317ELF3_9SPHI|nr:serine hydrolase domain-containing protein [Pedobacter yonginense]PWS26116.1 hypothetical protein DHW03_15065 [Pedobacter yonginense]
MKSTIIMLLLLHFKILGYCQDTKSNGNSQEMIKGLQSLIIKKMEESHVVGAAIALVDDQSVLWSSGFGYADLGKMRKVNAETMFSIQSISKMFTATAFLIAVENNRINLDDPLLEYYPSFRIKSRYKTQEVPKITFRHLLSHRAGLLQEAPLGNNYDTVHYSFEKHVESMNDSWLRFPVGKFYSYSNMGFDLVGYVLSKQSNMTFPDYMNKTLFTPLGMKNSTYDQQQVYNTGNFAKGYIESEELPKTYIADLAGGGLYSNVNEMAKFISFHLNDCKLGKDPLISSELHSQMYSVQYPLKNQSSGYGLGVRVKPYHGATLVQHAGGGYGYRAIQGWIPQYKIGVVILTNDGFGSSFSDEIFSTAMNEMIKLRLGKLPASYIDKQIDTLKLPADYLSKLEGTYKTNRRLISVINEKRGLSIDFNGYIVRLFAKSKTEFFSKEGDQYVFSLDERGDPKYFINLNGNNPDFYIFNDKKNENKGKIKPKWESFCGLYKGYNNGQKEEIKVLTKNGFLYTDFGGMTKVTEYQPGIFFTTDGESLIIKDDELYIGNRRFLKE